MLIFNCNINDNKLLIIYNSFEISTGLGSKFIATCILVVLEHSKSMERSVEKVMVPQWLLDFPSKSCKEAKTGNI